MPVAVDNPNSENAGRSRADVIASNDPTVQELPVSPAFDAPVSGTVKPTVGAVLREGREKMGLSAGDIASKLRMGLKQVTALENSDFASVPTGTFLRGFVRNYAKAVAVNADDVLALLEKTNRDAVAVKASTVVVPSQQNIKVPMPGGELATPKGRIVGIGVVVVLLLAAAWYWIEYIIPNRNALPPAPTTVVVAVPADAAVPVLVSPPTIVEPPNAAPVTDSANQTPAAPNNVEAAPMSTSPTASGAPIAQLPAPAIAKVPAPEATLQTKVDASPAAKPARESTASAPAGGAALGFTFSGESWVEVVDSGGKTVLSRRFKAGDAEEVLGRAPFTVVVGNANSTRMAFNGREFNLEPHTRGAVARVTVK